MYSQLGQVIFQGLFGFNSFEHTDTTTYAQHDLIGAKPILTPTGNDLEEISIELRLRAEFINPEQARLQLKKYKDEYEILPLIKGNGQYLGDFVITELSTSHVNTLSDGSVLESVLNVTLREYVNAGKLQQQQSAARKQAFAVGDKKPVSVGAVQVESVAQAAGRDLSAASSFSFVVDRKSSEYVNNVTQRQSIADRIEKSLQKMDDKLSQLNDSLEHIELLENVAAIYSHINTVRQRISDFSFPITSIDDLRTNNRNLQVAMRNLSAGSVEILNLILTRAA